jgi:hypothetical protein
MTRCNEEREQEMLHEIDQLRTVAREQQATIQGFIDEITRMKRCPQCATLNTNHDGEKACQKPGNS